jgi:hypothetical protein
LPLALGGKLLVIQVQSYWVMNGLFRSSAYNIFLPLSATKSQASLSHADQKFLNCLDNLD